MGWTWKMGPSRSDRISQPRRARPALLTGAHATHRAQHFLDRVPSSGGGIYHRTEIALHVGHLSILEWCRSESSWQFTPVTADGCSRRRAVEVAADAFASCDVLEPANFLQPRGVRQLGQLAISYA